MATGVKLPPGFKLEGQAKPMNLPEGFKLEEVATEKKAPSIRSKLGMGGIGYGAEAVKQGLGFGDVPHIAAKAVSGVFGGMPEEIAKKPIKFGLSGPIGVGLDRYAKDESAQLPFPKPKSVGGKMVGNAAELIAGGIPLESAITPTAGIIKNVIKPKAASMVGVGEKYLPKAKQLAENLLAHTEEARKTAGAMQGGYIDANADELVNAQKLEEIISQLPPKLQEAIHADPEIARTVVENIQKGVDPLGMAVETGKTTKSTIAPTLKNAERLRKLSKSHVPSAHWNFNAVDDTAKNAASAGYEAFGSLMKEGRPELAEAMGNYAQTMRASDQIEPLIQSQTTGYVKPEGTLQLFGKKAKGASIDAINDLAEHNPDIQKAVQEIKKFGSGVERRKYFGGLARKAVGGAATVFGGKKAWDILN